MIARITTMSTAAKALVALIFASLFFIGLTPLAAHADDPIDVTVNVTTKAGTPLAGLSVYAYPVENHAVVGEGIVANLGSSPKNYTFTTAGGNALDDETDYAFYFDVPTTATTAFDQFLGGTTFVEEATYWHYVTNKTTLDVTLATNSTFTGKVTGKSSKALSGVAVYPWRFDGNDWFRLDEAKATTSSSGVYTMRNLEPGTYRLEFIPKNSTGYISEFSGNTRVFDNAQSLNLGLGASISNNAGLVLGGNISGKVQLTDASLGGNVQSYGITAFAYPVLPGGAIDTSIAYPSAETGVSGAWTIKGLPAGDYKVKMYDTLDPDGPVFVDKWALNKDSAATANVYPVLLGKTVSAGTTTMKFYQDDDDTSLVLDVDDHSGNPVPNTTEVYIVSNDGGDFAAHFLLEGGSTYFPFMPIGTYDVFIDPHNGGADGPYVGTQEIFDATANTWNIDLATPSSFHFTVPPQIPNHATKVGSVYDVSAPSTSFDPEDVEYSYIWLRDDAPIFGSQAPDADSYTSRGVDNGHKISVIVRADAFGYAPIFATAIATDPVTIGDAPVSDPGNPPTVSGPVSVVPGSVLTAKVGTWDVSGLTFDYQWFSGGVAVGTNSRTYTVQPSDAGEIITFSVTAGREGHLLGAANAGNSVTVGYLAAPKVTKSSTFTVTNIADGIKLTATPGVWSPVPNTLIYEWFIGGVVYNSASSPVFECKVSNSCISTGLSGTLAIQLTVTAHKTGYLNGSKTYLVRKGTQAADMTDDGFVYDETDGGHPSFDNVSDPAYVSHVLQVSDPEYTYPDGTANAGAPAYQWQRKVGATWTNIAGKTGSTYVVAVADVGRELRVRATTTSALYPTITDYFIAGTGTLQTTLNDSHPDPYINGTVNTGTVKTLIFSGVWPVPGVGVAYQWYVCNVVDCSDTSSANPDWKAISKATAASYTPPAALVGQKILLQVTGSKSGYAPVVLRSPLLALDDSSVEVGYVGENYTKIVGGIVADQAAVGRTLTAKPGTLDRPTFPRTFMWQICDGSTGLGCVDAPGSPSGLTATPDASWLAAYGPETHVRFLDKVTGYFNGPSPLYPLTLGTISTTPSISKSAGATPTYTVVGAWDPAFTLDYEWTDNGAPVATTANYTPDAGNSPVVVEVTASRDGYEHRVYELVARKGTLATQPTTITGGTRVGDSLEANSFFIPVYGGSVVPKFQWYSGTTKINGKTTNEFVPTAAYVGKVLKVQVTLSSPYWNTKTYFTPAITIGSHLPATGTPVIVSSLPGSSPGSKLTVNTSSFGSGFTFTYVWERSADGGTTWATASTASSYTVSIADITKQIRVRVVAKKSGWLNSASIPSTPVSVSYSPALELSSPFLLGGTGKVDSAITTTTAWNTTGVAVSYSWTRNGVIIPGATGTSITPTASWIGDEIQAHATATKAGYLPVTVHSTEIRVTKAPAPTGTGFSTAPGGVKTPADTVTVLPGAWNVAGLTFEFTWYAVADNTHTTPLHSGATWANPPVGSCTVLVEATRSGYETGTAGVFVQITP